MPHTIPVRGKNSRLRMGVGLGVLSLLALVAAGIVSYVAMDRWVDHTLVVRQEVDDWFIALLDAETGVRGYLLSGDAGDLQPYEAALRRERKQAGVVRSLVDDNPVQVQHVEVAAEAALTTMNGLREVTTLVASGHRDQAIARVSTGDDRRAMGAFRAAIDRVQAEEGLLLERRRAQVRVRALVTLLAEVLLILSCAALLVVAWLRDRKHDGLLRDIASEARKHMTALSDLARSLSEARTRRQVAEAIVQHGMEAAGADTCTLYSADEDGKALNLIGDKGVASAVLDKIRRLSNESDATGTLGRTRSGTSTWIQNEAEYLALLPELASLKTEAQRAKAFWSVPFQVEGRVTGLLGMGFYQPRVFSPTYRAFVETYSKLCAQALQRATRMEREDEAHDWFNTTLRSIGDAVITTDPNGHITFMNPVAEALTHWSVGEAKGRHLDDVFCIYSEQTRATVESPVAKVLREGKVVGLANHTLLRSKHGVEVPIDDSGAPIRSEDGKLHGVVLVFRNVEQQKRERVRREFLAKAGEALVVSLDYQATLATVAQLAVPSLADWCSVDIIEAGSAYRQLAVAHVDPSKVRFARELAHRYPPDPNATTGAPQVIRSGKSELYTEIPNDLLEAGAQDAEHLRIIRELRLESAMVVPLLARGRTLGAMTFVHAESGRRYSADDLAFAEDFARRAALAIDNALALREAESARAQERALRTEAEVASRAKDDFLATVSHELRTPLNAILGWTVILRGRSQVPEVDKGLAVIERNARSQTKLIEDVLDVSRIISGKLALSIGLTDAGEAITAAIETVTPAAEAKSIVIMSEVADVPLTIAADPDRLQQIVWNLLSNAVKFTPKGGNIWIRAWVEGSAIHIEVKDSGEGIRPDALPHIFEPFHQADASTTRRHGGLGLGLAIVKQLVVAHGGVISAKSGGLGAGATFVVQLPSRAVIPPLIRSPRPPSSFDITAPPPDGGPRLDGLRLLVVDDEEDALELVTEMLRERGAEVHSSGSARDALDAVGAFKPDIIVSDIGMPGMDGYTLIRAIRGLPAEMGGRTPAVALTAYARGEDAQRAFAAGYQTHVVKPVEPGQLAQVIANLGGRTLDPL